MSCASGFGGVNIAEAYGQLHGAWNTQLRYQPWEHAIIQCNLSKKKACKIAREVCGPLHAVRT